jgi:ethylmalonyl-CoA/methylmalonyl-CoA decarboxylase
VDLNEARELLAQLGSHRERGAGVVRLELEDRVARVILDNPNAHNAMTIGMMEDLAAHVQRLQEWSGCVVLLQSGGSESFCAGGHLGEVQQVLNTPEQGETMCMAMGTVLNALLGLPQISVSLLDGAAIGGGAELLTATDFRIGSSKGSIRFVHRRLGVVPGWGGTGRLVRLLGPSKAMSLLLSAQSTDVSSGIKMGLMDQGYESLGPQQVADFIEPILACTNEVALAIKAQVLACSLNPLEDGLTLEAEAFRTVWAGKAHQLALAQFSEKRPAE